MPRNPYPLSDGSNAPGVTTIVGQLGKGEPLMNWAHRIGYESTIEIIKERFNEPHRVDELILPDYEEIDTWQSKRDTAGARGTDVHKLITDFLGGEEVMMPDDEVALNCFDKFLRWWAAETKGGNCTTIITETPYVSEKLRFGGTPDIIMVDKQKLVDIKTGGKWVYDEWWYQLAGYDILLRENGHKLKEYQILWLPKDGFDCPIRADLTREKRIFKNLLKIYHDRRAE